MKLISSLVCLSLSPDSAFWLSKPSVDRTQNSFSNLSSPTHHTLHLSSTKRLAVPSTHFEHPSFLLLPIYLTRSLFAHTFTCHPCGRLCILFCNVTLILESGLAAVTLSLPIGYGRSDIVWLPRPGQKSPHGFRLRPPCYGGHVHPSGNPAELSNDFRLRAGINTSEVHVPSWTSSSWRLQMTIHHHMDHNHLRDPQQELLRWDLPEFLNIRFLGN